MDMQAVATRVIGNALPSLDAGLSKLVTDDLRGGEHAIAPVSYTHLTLPTNREV